MMAESVRGGVSVRYFVSLSNLVYGLVCLYIGSGLSILSKELPLVVELVWS